MTPDQVRTTLKKLHDELGEAHTVDSESRALLQQVSTDIQRLLGEDAAQARAAHPEHEPRLMSLATRFEADHPTFAGTLRLLAEQLSRVGL